MTAAFAGAPAPRVLFWDIDGTLLTTGKAGVPAWEAAVLEVTGREFQLSSIRVPGLTDYQIAVRTFEMLGLEPDEAAIRRMVRRYEELLPASLPLKKGTVLPNVREILEHLSSRPDVRRRRGRPWRALSSSWTAIISADRRFIDGWLAVASIPAPRLASLPIEPSPSPSI